MAAIEPFTDEQARALVNLEQRYQVWMGAEKALAGLPYDLRRKRVAGRDYLYEIYDRSGNGRSLGAMDETHATRLQGYLSEKRALKGRRTESARALDESCRLYRALRLPMLPTEAGRILRESDRRSLLDGHLLVVGTNAMIAYAVEAGGFIRDAPDETQDFDVTWAAAESEGGGRPFWSMLKAVDGTFTVNTERPFQARNSKAYEVELLVAPSRAGGLSPTDQPRPVPLPEQEWLLKGRPIDRVVACRDASPARIVAPDPRWFALQKLWMSRQPKRNPLKRPKDARQGTALLNAIHEAMPQYPLDQAFEAEIPDDLMADYQSWKSGRPTIEGPSWF